MRRRRVVLVAGFVAVAVALLPSLAAGPGVGPPDSGRGEAESEPETAHESVDDPTVVATVPRPDFEAYDGWVDPASSGWPYSATVDGLLTFRGNPTRSWYGAGPVPSDPGIVWTYPETAMCGMSDPGTGPRQWCGTGWTGQPAIVEREDATWTIFGAYDFAVHFVDADTGEDLLPPFVTGDLVKGSVTVDPDGYPLVYFGSRDNRLRAVAIDRETPEELWSIDADAAGEPLWNDDWDGTPMVLDDFLFEGGENSWFHIVKLNRGYDEAGLVTVDPELVFAARGWDEELLEIHGPNVSIENSVAITGDVVYFANSGGLLQGWDIASLRAGGEPERVFRYWLGDDTDASIVVDDEGFLYAGVQFETGNSRSREVGQLVKIDPSDPDDPLVWSVFDTDALPGGLWATPAVTESMVYASTNSGRLLGVDRDTGAVVWEKQFGLPLWSSQVVVDDVLIQGDCSGFLHAYDISDPLVDPPELWSVELGGCIESTPAVWDGRIIVGTRAGYVHMVADET